MAKDIWYLKHRPSTFDEYIFQNKNDEIRIKEFIDKGYIPHLLFSGHRGTGKTTLAFLLANALGIDEVDVKIINASDENSVDTIRNKVKGFITSMAMSDFKIVFLDEAEALSRQAQDSLKSMMEEHADNARFIFSCNHPQKIIPEIRDSRVQQFHFKTLDKLSMLEQVAIILKKEKIKVTGVKQLEDYVDNAYPDMRRLVNLVQQNSVDGKLLDYDESSSGEGEVFVNLLYMIEDDKVMSKREYIYENITDDECMAVYDDFLSCITDIFKTKIAQKRAVVIIADHIHRDYFSAIKQATLESCLIKLADVYKSNEDQ